MFKKYLLTFLISMVPLVELRGGVPFGTGMNLPWHWCLLVCMIGNMLPVPFIFLFARKILVWGSDKPVIGKFFSWCLEKGEKGGKKLQEKAGRGMYVALLLIPCFTRAGYRFSFRIYSFSELKKICGYGFLYLVYKSCVALMTLFLNRVLSAHGGVTFVAANSIIFSVELIIGAFPSGFGSTTSLLIGMEKERDGDAAAARLCRRIVRMSVIVNLIQIAVVLLLANQIVGMFSPQSESVAVMAAWGLRLYALSVLPNTVNYIVRNYEQNMNHTGAAYFICLMNHIALPAAVGFMLLTFAQLRYIWLCFVIGQGACLLITWYIMRQDAMAIQKETVS